MKEKTTDELLNILQGCSNLSHLEDTLQILPEQSEYTFTSYLSKLLIEKNISKAKVISEANLARTYGYQIFQGEKNPGRDKIIAITFAMGLSLEESNRLLTLAHTNILYSKNKRDAILIFAIENKYSLRQVNDLLYEMGEDIIE